MGGCPTADPALCKRKESCVPRRLPLCSPRSFDPFLMFTFQKIMKRLIKRYVLKAQVDRENDEVNEGKWLDSFPAGQRSDMVSRG